MFNTNPAAPVSKIKLPSVVSAFALMSIRLPARLKGITHEIESALMTGIWILIFLQGVCYAFCMRLQAKLLRKTT
jgi:hypothetical protein